MKSDDTELAKLGLDRGLVIRQPYVGMILDGEKTWELRSRPTKIRGRIGLIEAGSGLVVGEAVLVMVMRAPRKIQARYITRGFHRIPMEDFHLMDRWPWAWVLEDAIRYETPVPYPPPHPQGAVMWANLKPTSA